MPFLLMSVDCNAINTFTGQDENTHPGLAAFPMGRMRYLVLMGLAISDMDKPSYLVDGIDLHLLFYDEMYALVARYSTIINNNNTLPDDTKSPIFLFRQYSKSCIDESNDRVSRSWIVFCHEMEVKLTSAAEFSAAKDFAISKW